MKFAQFMSLALALRFPCIASAKNVVVESLHQVPVAWRRVGDAPPNTPVTFRIALTQPGLQRFEKLVYDIANPDSPQYGQHLSREQAREMLKPRDESTGAVIEWLEAAGILRRNIEDAGDWINLKTTAAVAEKLLDTNFAVYQHADIKKIRTLQYSVPADIRSHITMIQPTTKFTQLRAYREHILEQGESTSLENFRTAAMLPTKAVDPSCNNTITPECLRALYKIGDHQADPSVRKAMGVSGFLKQWAKHDALDTFLEKFAPYAATQNFSTVPVNGGEDKQNSTSNDSEANLDIQYVASLAFNTTIKFYSVGGLGPLIPDLDQPDPAIGQNEPYLEYVTYLLGLSNEELPHTLTTSYGENEQSVPLSYAQKVCSMFGELGARGVSVIFSSGDTGPGSACQTNDGKNQTRFSPIWPAACPFVTSVGGTVGVEPERAVSFSSGGFSDIFPRPDYQKDVVDSFIGKLGSKFQGLYNTTGRGFPDVAAQGRNFAVVDMGMVTPVSGTSASAPAFAAIISLLNNARLAAGDKPLGFLNPMLYSSAVSRAKALTDIVDGRSSGCTGVDKYSGLESPLIPGAGWDAVEGWDPVTGLGTPRFDLLLPLTTGNKTTVTRNSPRRV